MIFTKNKLTKSIKTDYFNDISTLNNFDIKFEHFAFLLQHANLVNNHLEIKTNNLSDAVKTIKFLNEINYPIPKELSFVNDFLKNPHQSIDGTFVYRIKIKSPKLIHNLKTLHVIPNWKTSEIDILENIPEHLRLAFILELIANDSLTFPKTTSGHDAILTTNLKTAIHIEKILEKAFGYTIIIEPTFTNYCKISYVANDNPNDIFYYLQAYTPENDAKFANKWY